MVLLGSLYLEGPDSKNSINRQANTPLSGFPMGNPIFLFVEFADKFEVDHVCYVFADVDSGVYHIYPTPLLWQDMTQGQFLCGV